MTPDELNPTRACRFRSPIGVMRLVENGAGICALTFLDGDGVCPQGDPEPAGLYLAEAVRQLDEYFAGRRIRFTVPLAPSGTPFQRRVWRALEDIPFGETRSYGEIAAQLGQPGAARAVGGANRRNPVCILIPCHRVVAADGGLGGYAWGEARKRFLLALERDKTR